MRVSLKTKLLTVTAVAILVVAIIGVVLSGRFQSSLVTYQFEQQMAAMSMEVTALVNSTLEGDFHAYYNGQEVNQKFSRGDSLMAS